MDEVYKIKSSEFVISSASGKNIEIDRLPEIIFTGKSNVGKSSLINSILNRKRLAKTGNTPGKTKLINFFLVNSAFYFVDLPGYGYAAVSKTEREKWSKMIKTYLNASNSIKLAFSILDIRHKPTQNDITLIEMFNSMNIPQIIILNKKDKISNNVLFVQSKMFKEALKGLDTVIEIIPYSAVTGFNRDKVLNHIGNFSGENDADRN
ncbi:MAG: YihA family ribosome biogenesis GTP-binding protein [Candidatus Delongbacteria bacterium]|nr:YihA family ribosome biogenesis GTP-binding protein [Candidatus Delongbacteria bacterium]